MELENNRTECRWFMDERHPKQYCAEPTVDGSSYCPAHHGIVYVQNSKARPRQRTPIMLPVDPIAALKHEPEKVRDVVEAIGSEE